MTSEKYYSNIENIMMYDEIVEDNQYHETVKEVEFCTFTRGKHTDTSHFCLFPDFKLKNLVALLPDENENFHGDCLGLKISGDPYEIGRKLSVLLKDTVVVKVDTNDGDITYAQIKVGKNVQDSYLAWALKRV